VARYFHMSPLTVLNLSAPELAKLKAIMDAQPPKRPTEE
jgi:hypothetical protein